MQPLQLMAHSNRLARQVHVRPAQPERFALTQPEGQGNGPARSVTPLGGTRQHLACVCLSERHYLGRFPGGDSDHLARISRQMSVVGGYPQRRREGSTDVGNAILGESIGSGRAMQGGDVDPP
jgi:hypothetical protein